MVGVALLALADFVIERLNEGSLLPHTAFEMAQMVFGAPLILAAGIFWSWRCFSLQRWACEFLAVLAWCVFPVAFSVHPLAGVLAIFWMVTLTWAVITAWPQFRDGW